MLPSQTNVAPIYQSGVDMTYMGSGQATLEKVENTIKNPLRK